MHAGHSGQNTPHTRPPPTVAADVPESGGRSQQEQPLGHHPAEEKGIWKERQKENRPPGGTFPQLPGRQPVQVDAPRGIAQKGHHQARRHGIMPRQGANQPHQPGIEGEKDQKQGSAVLPIAGVAQFGQANVVPCIPFLPDIRGPGQTGTRVEHQAGQRGHRQKDGQAEEQGGGEHMQKLPAAYLTASGGRCRYGTGRRKSGGPQPPEQQRQPQGQHYSRDRQRPEQMDHPTGMGCPRR